MSGGTEMTALELLLALPDGVGVAKNEGVWTLSIPFETLPAHVEYEFEQTMNEFVFWEDADLHALLTKVHLLCQGGGQILEAP